LLHGLFRLLLAALRAAQYSPNLFVR